MGAPIKYRSPLVVPQLRIARDGSRTVYKGNQSMEVAVATFDPSANTGERAIAAHGLEVYLPDNAVIVRAFYDVVTGFASAGGDAGTIAIHIQGANDLVAAIAISDGTDVWDEGIQGTLVGSPILGAQTDHDTAIELAALQAASVVKTTAEREIIVTVGGQVLTAGKLNVFVEYFVSD